MSVLQRENIDPMDLSTSSKGPNYWKTPANTLDDAACSGWLEKEGHMVKNWRRRWFVLWPASGSSWAQKHAESRWAQTHGSERTQQLLLYYESEESSAPKGIVPLQPGRFEIASEAGGPYRGEETLVLSVQAEAAVHSRYVIRSEEPGDPGDLPRWANMIRQGTGDPVEPQQQASVTVEKATYYRVDCPQRKKAPTVKDAVVWRNSPDMEDRVTEDDDDVDPDLAKGAEDGSIWRAVVETPEWVQAENGRWLPKIFLRKTQPLAVPDPASTPEPEPQSAGGGAAAAAGGADADGGSRPFTPPRVGTAASASAAATVQAPAPSPLPASASRREQTIKDFVVEDNLGNGAYARVIRATRKVDRQVVAIKVVNKSHVMKHNKVKYVKTERDILQRMDASPWITSLYSTFQSKHELYYVMELCPHGELQTQLERYVAQRGGVPLAAAVQWGAELTAALADLFAAGVIHRDLKPENILISESCHLKLCDFGTAKLVGGSGSGGDGGGSRRSRGGGGFSFVGSADFVSPELLADKPSAATAASDLWALGCIIYQMIAGSPPFKNTTDTEFGPAREYATMERIKHHDGTIAFPEDFPEDGGARELVAELLRPVPAERLGADSIGAAAGGGDDDAPEAVGLLGALRAHAFFAGVEWDALLATQAPAVLSETEEEKGQSGGDDEWGFTIE